MTEMRLPPVGFWSYARQDNDLSNGKLSSLRILLVSELQQQYGREQIRLFQDITTIPIGADWESEISGYLRDATFFIPIITPNFIQSEWCCREVSIFLDRQAGLFVTYPDLPRRSRIFPLYLIDIEGVDAFDPNALATLKTLQWFDFRHLRHSNYESEAARKALSELAASMRTLLQMRITTAPHTEKPAAPSAKSAPAAARASASESATATIGAPQAKAMARTQEKGSSLFGRWTGWTTEHRNRLLLALPGLAALILIWLLVRSGGGDADTTPEASIAETATPIKSTVERVEPQNWLYGRWGINGNCSSPMVISGAPGRLVIEFGGNRHERSTRGASAAWVVTDGGTYTRIGTVVRAREQDIDYEMTRCPN
ncbi:MAG: toll/interleukin-1 receptor domain-containing protein [Sphingomonas sp.]|nr:toll/interleukin-1 receptor domain-containing protein [Sphingomonas sp.]